MEILYDLCKINCLKLLCPLNFKIRNQTLNGTHLTQKHPTIKVYQVVFIHASTRIKKQLI